MAFNNPFSKLYEAIMARLEAQVPAIKYISLNLGQLENYNYAAGNKPSLNNHTPLLDSSHAELSQYPTPAPGT